MRYQKKYGFELNTKDGQEHLTWNCEGDAFKHAFGSALIAMEQGNFRSWGIGYAHEHEYLLGDNNHPNPNTEKNMDTNNNRVGRNIANELIRDYAGRWDNLSQHEKEDIIADRVWKHMQSGDIILDPSGRRKLKSVPREDKQNIKSAPKQSWDRYGNLTGYAVDIPDEEKIERYKKENELFSPENRVFYENELNPAKIPLGSFEDNYVQEFMKQYIDSGKNLPSEKELQSKTESGELIYVRNYTRADGTKVSGYYRTK